MFEQLEHPQQRAFLAAYASLGVVSRAAKAAGIARETHYEWLRTSGDYRQAVKRARRMAGGALEDEAVRRARYGVKDYVLFQGQVVEYQGKPLRKRRYSDQLLSKLLGSHLPKQYAERKSVEHKGEIKHKVTHKQKPDLSKLSTEDLKTLERLALKSRTGAGSGNDSGGTDPESEKEN